MQAASEQRCDARCRAICSPALGCSPAVRPAPTPPISPTRTTTRCRVVDLDKMEVDRRPSRSASGRAASPFTQDGKYVLVCAGDDDTIQIIDTTTLKIVGDLPSGPDPETFALQPRRASSLYVANENDALVTVIDIADAQGGRARFRSASSRRAWRSAPTARSSSTPPKPPTWRISSTTRPRRSSPTCWSTRARAIAEFKHDGSEVWVTSEVGGTVSVIDPVKHVGQAEDHASRPGPARRSRSSRSASASPPTASSAFVALGPANRVAVIDAATYEVQKYLLVGQRVWQLALHAGRQVPAHHQRRLQRRLGDRRRPR